MKTSVILCTRNRASEVETFVGSLASQTSPPDELVVVDSSDDPLRIDAEIRCQHPQESFRVLCFHTAPGLTLQREEGIRRASGDILYFFDDDVVLRPDYLERMNEVYRTHAEYVGGMGTDALLPSCRRTKARTFFARIFGMLRSYGDGRFYRSGFPRFPHGRVKDLSDTDVLSGFAMSFRSWIFDEFQFDQALTGHSYMEDVDLSRRVSLEYRLFFCPGAKLEHRHVYGQRPADDFRERRAQYMYNHRYFFFKNSYGGDPVSLVAHWWSILGLLLHACFKPSTWLLGYLDGLLTFHQDRRKCDGA